MDLNSRGIFNCEPPRNVIRHIVLSDVKEAIAALGKVCSVLFIICAVISNKHNYSMCFNTELLCSVLKLTPILNLACAYFFKYVANMVVLNHDPVPPENSVESYSRRTR